MQFVRNLLYVLHAVVHEKDLPAAANLVAQLEPGEGWTPDHLLLAALVQCSIESLTYHARRAGHEVTASGSAHAIVTRRVTDGRYAVTEADVRIDAQLRPRTTEPDELTAKAERDCFVGASLTIAPRYEWHVS